MTTADPVPPTRPTVTTAEVAALHPHVPGMRAVLEEDARAALLAPIVGDAGVGGAYDVVRLRIKDDRSLAAALRPRGVGRPLLARAVRAQDWDTKAAKHRRAADRAGGPLVVRPDLGVVVSGVEGDRHLTGLRRLAPDTGEAVDVDGERVTTTTLSYNPARRWVGLATPDSGEPFTLRLHAGEPVPVRETWVPGTPVTGADLDDETAAAILTAVAAGLSHRGGLREVDPAPRVRSAARGLGSFHHGWAERAVALADLACAEPDALSATAAGHGDLSPDQVILDPEGRVHVVDWDQVGLHPRGWDVATWIADGVMTGEIAVGADEALGGSRPHPAVLAAAALMRAPDPFRRQRPDWAAATSRLLDHAATVLGRDR